MSVPRRDFLDLAIAHSLFVGKREPSAPAFAYSPTFAHWIGLALLANGPARLGEAIRVYDPVRNGDLLAEIVHPVFYDPEGIKLRG